MTLNQLIGGRMKKILTALVAGTFAVGLYAAGPNQPVSQNDSTTQKAFSEFQKNLPDSIKLKIEEHLKAVITFNTEFEQAKMDFKAKIDSERVAWQTKLDGVHIPDSLKGMLCQVQLPDSIKTRVDQFKALNQARIDSLKIIIEKRRADAKQKMETALAKLDSDTKVKYEKALVEIEKKKVKFQAKAEEAQKKLDEKKAAIIEKINKQSNVNQ